MAVEALIRKMLNGHPPAPGARPAVQDLELSDYRALFAKRTIYMGSRDESAGPWLFERLLGNAWHDLPEAVKRLHTFSSRSEVMGRCVVERGRGLVSNCIASLFRFTARRRRCTCVRQIHHRERAGALDTDVRSSRLHQHNAAGERSVRAFAE